MSDQPNCNDQPTRPNGTQLPMVSGGSTRDAQQTEAEEEISAPSEWQVGGLLPYQGIGRWQIDEEKRGGMGVVYLVHQEFGGSYAAKTFQDEAFACNPSVAERFVKEAATWIALDVHPNITTALFVEHIEGKPIT